MGSRSASEAHRANTCANRDHPPRPRGARRWRSMPARGGARRRALSYAVAEVLDHLGEGAGAVAELVFHFGGKLAEALGVAFRDEEGVVAEAAGALLGAQNAAF